MQPRVYDLVVIGGGINGAGIAADAAGRGLSVLLAEQADLGSGTSSASSKLVHGGLRYLEYYEFRLVREALQEREVLLAKAPHIIHPLRFVLPQVGGGRPALMLRAGLFLYDHLARRREIPGSGVVDLSRDGMGRALQPGLTRRPAFTYWDCWVDDARLVVLNARAAADLGAEILPRTRVVKAAAMAADGLWRVELADARRNAQPGAAPSRVVLARALVNAAGPWVGAVAGCIAGLPADEAQVRVRLVKGSHIVVPRIAGAEDAFLFQHPDGRVVFALPFAHRFTMIGTTDVPFLGDPGAAAISAEETAYLLDLANRHFLVALTEADIRWSFAGVRPLYDDATGDPSAVTRDYRLELRRAANGAPLLTVLGGKITTYRRLAETALAKLAPCISNTAPAWTAAAPLPGGTFASPGGAGFLAWKDAFFVRHAGLPSALLHRLAHTYGTLADDVLGDARKPADLGPDLGFDPGGGLSAREVSYLKASEWAMEPDDVLWRRTKCALAIAPAERACAAERISKYL